MEITTWKGGFGASMVLRWLYFGGEGVWESVEEVEKWGGQRSQNLVKELTLELFYSPTLIGVGVATFIVSTVALVYKTPCKI